MGRGKFHSATALAPAAHIGFFMFPGRAACFFTALHSCQLCALIPEQKHLLIFKKESTLGKQQIQGLDCIHLESIVVCFGRQIQISFTKWQNKSVVGDKLDCWKAGG